MIAILKSWLPLALYVSGVFLLSSIPRQHLPPDLFPHSDKVIHFLVYAGIGFLGGRALARPWWAILLGVVIAATDEQWQRLTSRQASLEDWLADCFGVMLGVIVYGWYAKTRSSRKTPAA
jgi:VanZ family protein